MTDWGSVIAKYANSAKRFGGSLVAMHSLVEKIHATFAGHGLFPSMSHETLVLSQQQSDYRFGPSVTVTPSSTGEFVVSLRLGLNEAIASERVSHESAFAKSIEYIEKCLNIIAIGPQRGFALLCDIRSLFIETKLNGKQTELLMLDHAGVLKARGLVFPKPYRDDLFIFSIPVASFDGIVYWAENAWLERTGVYDRQGGKSCCTLTIGFKLVDDSERILSFVSPNDEIDAPDDVISFVENARRIIMPFAEEEAARVSSQNQTRSD